MKRKGISLIVLIITCVVIIILATAIIVNIAQTNMIENAKEAVVKQDFKTMQDELTLYKADKYVETRGNFKAENLNVTAKDEIAEIIPSINNTKYADYVVIENGKIAITDTMTEPDKTWALEALGEIKVTTNTPVEPDEVLDATAPTVPVTLEFVITDTTIKAVASGSIDETDAEVEYEYSIDNKNWQGSGLFENLEALTSYTIYVRAIDDAGNVSEVKEGTATTKYALITDSNKTLNGKTATYSNPIIPVGFRALETADATWSDADKDGNPDGWNNGLVIEDEKGNEFVWVPCTLDGANGTITYEKNFTYKSSYTATSANTSDDSTAFPYQLDGTTIVNENTQIDTYGGFYIGRYEAGVPANQTTINGKSSSTSNKTGIPVVQKGATVWTNISYTNANTNAKSFIDTTYVKSGLVTGTAWDTVCSWIDSEIDLEGNILHNVSDCVSWGNYSSTTGVAQYDVDGIKKISGIKQTAGKSEYWKAKNIYDFAGNTNEWTGEKATNNTGYIGRSGYYDVGGAYRPTSCRSLFGKTTINNAVSFRVLLYVM